jgi:hypothetical protein
MAFLITAAPACMCWQHLTGCKVCQAQSLPTWPVSLHHALLHLSTGVRPFLQCFVCPPLNSIATVTSTLILNEVCWLPLKWSGPLKLCDSSSLPLPLLQVLEAQGHSLLSPSDRTGLHPLVVPLTTFSSSSSSSTEAGQLGHACAASWCLFGSLFWLTLHGYGQHAH